MADFMGLCLELKTEIFDYVFASPSSSSDIDILSKRVLGYTAIRAVSKTLYDESEYAYKQAEKKVAIERKTIITAMQKGYETITPFIPAIIVPNICLLATQLSSPPATCKHVCAAENCYMCEDPVHRRCFECGKNLAIALYCRMPKEARTPDDQAERKPPTLLQPNATGSGPVPTYTGRLVAKLEQTKYLPPPDSFGRRPWAFNWWQCEYLGQQARDLRCCIRRFAVKKYWNEAKWQRFKAFDEGTMAMIEREDRRGKRVEIIRRTIGKGVLEWRGEYERRVREEIGRVGGDMRVLIPGSRR